VFPLWDEIVLADGLSTPSTVAKTAAFGRSQAGAERTDQKGCRQPERQLCRCLSCRVDIGFGLGYDLVDSLISIRLAETGFAGDNLYDILAVGRLEIESCAQVVGKQAGKFGSGIGAICGVSSRGGI
jgi:hypothetical protein